MKHLKTFENNNKIIFEIGDIVKLKQSIPPHMIDEDKKIPKPNTEYKVLRIYQYNTKFNINDDIDDIYIDYSEVTEENYNIKTLIDVVDIKTNDFFEGHWCVRFFSVLRHDTNKYNL